MQWTRTFLLGVAVSAIASTLLLSGTLAFLADYALVGVFVVAPGLQTRTALAALHRSLSPIWPVLRAGVAYWAGASIIFALWLVVRGLLIL